LFNAREEFEDSTPMWVKFPILPIELWHDSGLKEIGDALGNFITADNSHKYISSRSMARILVDIDIQQGLFESIKLMEGDQSYTQILDYLNIPFKCVHCHNYGHIVEDYMNKF
jgi:hypothetical protein